MGNMVGECAARAGERIVGACEIGCDPAQVARAEYDAGEQCEGDEAFHHHLDAEAASGLFDQIVDPVDDEIARGDGLKRHHGDRADQTGRKAAFTGRRLDRWHGTSAYRDGNKRLLIGRNAPPR